MQTQPKVRFYITQNDNQPVVRTIAVPARAVEQATVVEQPVTTTVMAAPAQPQRK
jgi:hypothetical protein